MEEKTFLIELVPFKLVKEKNVYHAFATIEGYEQIGGYGITSDDAILSAIFFVKKLQMEMVRRGVLTSRMPEDEFKTWVAKKVIDIKA